jgi:hypothetical protein
MGKGSSGGSFDPEVRDEPGFQEQLARLQRLTASPREAARLQRVTNQLDVRHVLEVIDAPTLVVFLARAPTGRDNALYLAEHIANARFVELPGYHYFTSERDCERLADEIVEFVTGEAPAPDHDRVLATVLFTDLVGSTEGGGFLAVFDGPARARCVARWSSATLSSRSGSRSDVGSTAVRSRSAVTMWRASRCTSRSGFALKEIQAKSSCRKQSSTWLPVLG